MTVEELGRRMSCEEFEHWKVFMAEEGVVAAASMRFHASLLAAAHNGPCVPPRGTKAWRAADFLPHDPWAEPVIAPPKPVTRDQRRAAIEAAAQRAGMET
ncbi:hypothetical protein [Methylibium sp.]|uniref:hypothetical protein n=1 Tax=Methylibium sp. TaxID=2067992 RepID=UPI003BA92302